MNSVIHVFSPLFGLTFNVFLQIFTVRYIRRISYFRSILLGFLTGLIWIILSFFIFDSNPKSYPIIEILAELGMNVITYSFLSYCYFAFINTGVTAIRLRLLQELESHPEGLSLKELLMLYNSNVIIQQRLERLYHNGQILFDGSRYFTKFGFVTLIMLIIEVLKFLILGKKMRI